MLETPEDPAAPLVPASNDGPDPAPPDPETIRQEYRREEALVRALGRVQIAFGLLAAALTAFSIAGTLETYRIVSAPGAKVSADWVFDPWRIAFVSALAVYGLAGMVVGNGLRRLRWWAPRAETAVLLLGIIIVLMAWILVAVGDEQAHWLTSAVMMPIFALPGLIFAASKTPAVRTVLSADYAEIVAATPRVRVKPRLPWSLRLTFLLLVPLFLAAGSVVDEMLGPPP